MVITPTQVINSSYAEKARKKTERAGRNVVFISYIDRNILPTFGFSLKAEGGGSFCWMGLSHTWGRARR